MTGSVADLFGDADLLAYESTLLDQFDVVNFDAKRVKACEDWLWPIMRSRGFDLARWRIRYQPDAVQGYTSSAYSDLTSATQNDSADDVDLASVLAASGDYLYIGSTEPFRGLSVRMLDSVSSASATLTVQAWCDSWRTLTVTDGTQVTAGKPFSRGGRLTWTVPEDWVGRKVNAIGPYYWVRVNLSAAPTGATVSQIGCLRRSVVCSAVTMRTLASIFREAPISQDGPWLEKATYYANEADMALERAIPLLGGEFDTATEDDVIDADEAAQTADEATNGGAWGLERG